MKKKIITAILATTMVLAITACGSNTNESSDGSTEASAEVAEQDADMATDDTIEEQTTDDDNIILSLEELIALSDEEFNVYISELKKAYNEGIIDEDTYNTANSVATHENECRNISSDISYMKEKTDNLCIDLGGGYEYLVDAVADHSGAVAYIVNKDTARRQELYPYRCFPWEFELKELDAIVSLMAEYGYANTSGTYVFAKDDTKYDRLGNQYNLAIEIATNELYIGVGEAINNYYKYTNIDGTKTIYFHNDEEITEQEYNDAM